MIDLRSDVADVTERRALCDEFFVNVYKDAFSKPDQIETPDVWLPLINEDQPPPRPILHLIVARKRGPGAGGGGAVVGGIVIEYFRQSGTALATYLVVAPEERRRGLARRLLENAIERVAANNGGVRPLVFAEVERPEAQRSRADRRSARARLSIIAALGGRQLEFGYIQPRLGARQRAVEDLMLVLFAPNGKMLDSAPAATVEAFVDEFFSSLGQRESLEFERVLKSLPKNRIPLKDLHKS